MDNIYMKERAIKIVLGIERVVKFLGSIHGMFGA